MMIYIVSKLVDREDDQSSTTMSVHVDRARAETRRKAIDDVGEFLTYGVIEDVELDLKGLTVAQLGELTKGLPAVTP